MRKLLVGFVFFSALILMSSVAYCQNFNLNINLSDGSTVTFELDDIQRIEFANITGIEDSDQVQQVIQAVKLKQNYPNPFNPTTTIEYQLPKKADVKISIYNLHGQLVNEILNETQTEGVHQVSWDGTNLNNKPVASGIYFYTIKSEDIILSKKMVLLK